MHIIKSIPSVGIQNVNEESAAELPCDRRVFTPGGRQRNCHLYRLTFSRSDIGMNGRNIVEKAVSSL